MPYPRREACGDLRRDRRAGRARVEHEAGKSHVRGSEISGARTSAALTLRCSLAAAPCQVPAVEAATSESIDGILVTMLFTGLLPCGPHAGERRAARASAETRWSTLNPCLTAGVSLSTSPWSSAQEWKLYSGLLEHSSRATVTSQGRPRAQR